MKKDRRVAEGPAPLNHRCVIVWVRDGNCVDTTECVDRRPGVSVEERNAVPQNVSLRCLYQKGPLANPECGLRVDGEQMGLFLLKGVSVDVR